MAQTCTVDSLVTAGEKLAPLSRPELRAILIYVLTKYLKALGGTDYTTNIDALLTAAKTWPGMDPKQNIAGFIEIVSATANGHGAAISSDVNSLIASAKFIQNADFDHESILLFLSCAIGAKL